MRRARAVSLRGTGGRLDDAGQSLVEVLVAVLLLTLIGLPITFILISTQKSSNTFHLRAEATDLATQALETAQYETANGVNPTSGTTTSTQYSGGDAFTVSVDFELVAGTGASSSLCATPSGTTSSRIWSVKATTAWLGGKVVETTLVSPSYADLADLNAAEIAVPVYNADDSTFETTTPINISVQGSCASGSCGTIPSNESLSESANTGSTGCAVFPDLYAGAGVTYTITASSNPGYVDPNELSDNPTAPGDPTRTGVSVQPNTVTVLSDPFILAQGALTTVEFQTCNFVTSDTTSVTCTADASVSPAPDLPISVQSPTLLCSALAAETCVLGNGTATGGFSSTLPFQTALLFPGPATTPNYSAWAGDQADAEPSYDGDYGADVATSFTASSGAAVTVTLPVYPLSLTVTKVNSDAGTLSAFTAADVGGGATLSWPASGSSAVGLPLGQFEIGAVVSGTNSTVSSGGSSPVYVWILPTGVCESSTPLTSPCSSPSTSAISVTVG